MEKRKQMSQGPQDLRNDVAKNSLSFLFTLFIPDLELKKLATLMTADKKSK